MIGADRPLASGAKVQDEPLRAQTWKRSVIGIGTVTATVRIIGGTATTDLTDPTTDRTMATMVIAPTGVPVSVCGLASSLTDGHVPRFVGHHGS
jgi:hypothetical protein